MTIRASIVFLATAPLYLFSSFNEYMYRFQGPSFSNYGTIGLINAPTARFHEEGTLAFTWSHNQPYLRGSIVAYPFSWFEASYQYADINNYLYSSVKEFSGGQSLKDKSFDAKFRLIQEGSFLPSIAIGFRDLAGTGIFSSEYIVASKQFSSLDFTLGLGWGALSGGDKYSNFFTNISEQFETRNITGGQGGEFSTNAFFSGDMALFGGIEYKIPFKRGLKLKLEYDPINYQVEGLKKITNAESSWNFGFVYPVSNNVTTRLGITRGNNLNFQFSYHLPLGRRDPIIKKRDNLKLIENADIIKSVLKDDLTNDRDYKALILYLSQENQFYVQTANISEDRLEITYGQDRYFEASRAIGRASRVLDQIIPEDITTFVLSNKNAGFDISTVEINRESLRRYQTNKLTQDLMLDSKFYNKKDIGNEHEFQPSASFPSFNNSITPGIRSQIGGPDGFYFGELGLNFSSEIILSDNINIDFAFSAKVADNFSALKLKSDSVLPRVRSEVIEYLKASDKYHIPHFQLNYFKSPLTDVYFKFSAGLFEQMFGGYGFEGIYKPFARNWSLGLEIWKAKQRDYNMMLDFKDYETLTGHVNFIYTEPRTKINIYISGGRYLAKDSGFTFDFSRRFKSGMNVGAFFSLTDISKEEFGEGSFDKGIYFNVPVQVFFEKYRRGQTLFALRPLTRDGAARLSHQKALYTLISGSTLQRLKDDWDQFYD